MSGYRVTMSFDLQMANPDVARRVGAEFLTDKILEGIAEGGWVEGDTEATLNSPRAIASTVAVAILARGASTVEGASVANIQVRNESL